MSVIAGIAGYRQLRQLHLAFLQDEHTHLASFHGFLYRNVSDVGSRDGGAAFDGQGERPVDVSHGPVALRASDEGSDYGVTRLVDHYARTVAEGAFSLGICSPTAHSVGHCAWVGRQVDETVSESGRSHRYHRNGSQGHGGVGIVHVVA